MPSDRRNPGVGFGLPPPDTGNLLLDWTSRVLQRAILAERRVDPFFRPAFDKLLRGPLSRLTTALINWQRRDEGLAIAEERAQPEEEVHLDDIITTYAAQTRRLWNPGHAERGANTKTHGIVRAELTVRDDLPEHMRRGIFAERMPIENNGVLWPTKLAPRVPAAVLRIPTQRFDSPEQLEFAKVLSFNPWHCIPEHRPLGNQNRARKRLYYELSRLRQQMNGVEHYEPTGDETFL